MFYGKINNWGTFTPQEFDKHNVWDENHENHKEFIKHVVQRVLFTSNIS